MKIMLINCPRAFAKQLLMLLLVSVLVTGCNAFSSEETASQDGDTGTYRTDAPEDFFTTDAEFDNGYFTNMRAGPSANEVTKMETTEYYRSAGLQSINAATVHAHNADGTGQIISMIDTPIDMGHVDLQGSFVDGYDASSDTTAADATNCRIEFCGTNHGTHVAGVLTANRNDTGVLGVAYNAKIKSVAIFGNGNAVDVNQKQLNNAIRAASDPSIAVMNNSWSSTASSRATYGGKDVYFGRAPGKNFMSTDGRRVSYRLNRSELRAWRDAVADDTIVVFANGNHGFNSETGRVSLYDNVKRQGAPIATVDASELLGAENANLPDYRGSYAAYDKKLQGKWLTVISVDPDTHVIGAFSNGCGIAQDFCLAAPGTNITSTTINDGYGAASGTSVSAPYVSGSVALLKQTFPSLSSEETVSLLLATATDLGEEGTDPVYGRGMINLEAAIAPQGMLRVVGYDNSPLATGTLMAQSSITLSNHFGTAKNPLSTGVRDNYNRTFVAIPAQTLRQPMSFGLDDYMNNLTHADNAHDSIVTLNERTSVHLAQKNADGDNLFAMTHLYQLGNMQGSAKFSYQENYQHDDLSYIGITRSQINLEQQKYQPHLRFVDIRPAASDLLKFQTDHRLKDVSLTPYAVKGNFDTGQSFQELGADINYQYRDYFVKFGIGSLHEHQQFLGATTTGAYAIRDKSQTHFNELHVERQLLGGTKQVAYLDDNHLGDNHLGGNHLGGNHLGDNHLGDNEAKPATSLIIHANYADYRTDVPMAHASFVNIDNLSANRYEIGLKANHLLQKNDQLNFNISTKLGVRTGTLQQNSVMGYRTDGSFDNVSQSYSLASDVRHQQMALTYQGELFAHRMHQTSFFATLKHNVNYQHYAGLTQTEFITGLQTNF